LKSHRSVGNEKQHQSVDIPLTLILGGPQMLMRFVSLNYPDGKPVCAPIFVSLERRNYQPTDIEFEEEALRFAMRDGLVRRRQDVVAEVRKTAGQ
jgi:hypothetical protein